LLVTEVHVSSGCLRMLCCRVVCIAVCVLVVQLVLGCPAIRLAGQPSTRKALGAETCRRRNS
jgi:hypothetical protein